MRRFPYLLIPLSIFVLPALRVGMSLLIHLATEALRWFRKAAEQRDAEIFRGGHGGKQDYEEAVRKGTEQAHVEAQFNLGKCASSLSV